MDALRRKWGTATLPESSIALVGLALALVGLTLQDSVGVTSLLTAVGIGLLVAGTVYVATEGSQLTRLTIVFVSLVAVQLLAFGGPVRWIGGVTIGAVVVATSYTRLSE